MASVEARSEHPIARAIVSSAETEGLSLPVVTGFASETGFGVTAMAGEAPVQIGADRYMARLGLDVACLLKMPRAWGQRASPRFMQPSAGD